MTREHIIQLAKECGFESHDTKLNFRNELEAFYRAAQNEAYEKAAHVCENRHWTVDSGEHFAEAIRKLKEESCKS